MKFENIERAATLYKNYQAAIEKEKNYDNLIQQLKNILNSSNFRHNGCVQTISIDQVDIAFNRECLENLVNLVKSAKGCESTMLKKEIELL